MQHEALTVEHLRDLDIVAASHPRGVAHLSAASGLVWHADEIIVVADDEHHIGIFGVAPDGPGRLVRVLPGDLPVAVKARKKHKPDTEALLTLPASAAWPAGALLALGSGSRPNRQMGLLMPFDALAAPADTGIAQIDLTPLYAPLHEHFADLNIEGAFVCGNEFMLLQRGNKGAHSPNASIAYALADVLAWLTAGVAAPHYLRVQQHVLGSVGGIPLSFTDGTPLPDGRWLFSAVAENTDNSYADGVCAGAVIGVMGVDGVVSEAWPLPAALKVEGVAARVEDDAITLLMTTDADDPLRAAHLLRARLRIDGI